jgi:tellurite resistance protein TehA-like permease
MNDLLSVKEIIVLWLLCGVLGCIFDIVHTAMVYIDHELQEDITIHSAVIDTVGFIILGPIALICAILLFMFDTAPRILKHIVPNKVLFSRNLHDSKRK